MSYNIKFTDIAANPVPITVEDQSLNQETSLEFIGKNFPGYARSIGENFLHLLENFARPISPTNPIEGQLWYDTGTNVTPARPQLKVFDGTKWTEAGNVKKGTVQPAAEVSIIGDLWVDLSNKQLYLFTGSTWVLVGPQFSQGSLSGLKAELLIDRDTNTSKTVLVMYADSFPVIIISKDAFTPKVAISGFETIKQGINLSTVDFDLNGIILTKYWGTSEKADALVIGNKTIPSTSFLRNDVVSTTNYALNVRNGSGISIGQSLETTLSTRSDAVVLTHKTQGQSIVLRTTSAGQNAVASDILTVNSTNGVSVNGGLTLTGNILTPGTIKTTNTTQAISVGTGALQVAGGASVGGQLIVGGSTDISAHMIIGSTSQGIAIRPRINEYHDIGSSTYRFRNVYAKDFTGGTFTGEFVGGLTGSVQGSADSLSQTAAFSIRGDVVSNVIPFNGASPVAVKNIALAARSALGIATITTTVPHGYLVGYIVSVDCSVSTFNTSGSVITGTPTSTTFTYVNTGATVSSSASGTISVNPGGSFYSVLSDTVISNKIEVDNTSDSDYFLVYRATDTPPLKKISKAVLFSTSGTVPPGAIFPYAGSTAPSGYLLCDGSEQSRGYYPDLFNAIGYNYGSGAYNAITNPTGLVGYETFRLPDLRGRVALGRDNMDNANNINIQIIATSVERQAITALGAETAKFIVNDSLTTNGPFQVGKSLGGTGLYTATTQPTITTVEPNTPVAGYTTITVIVASQPTTYPSAANLTINSIGTTDGGGGSANRVPSAASLNTTGGDNTAMIEESNLPDHLHDLKDSTGNQFYGIRSASGSVPEPEVDAGTLNFVTGSGQFLKNSGGIKTTGSLGQPIDIMNPFNTINYIIFTGKNV